MDKLVKKIKELQEKIEKTQKMKKQISEDKEFYYRDLYEDVENALRTFNETNEAGYGLILRLEAELNEITDDEVREYAEKIVSMKRDFMRVVGDLKEYTHNLYRRLDELLGTKKEE